MDHLEIQLLDSLLRLLMTYLQGQILRFLGKCLTNTILMGLYYLLLSSYI